MNRHPYLRAYMAGTLVPNWFLLFGLTVFLISENYYSFSPSLERVLVFPAAVVPNLWGLWNLLYLRFELKSRFPLGAWGAILPFFLVPAGIWLAGFLDVANIAYADMLIFVPIGSAIYYLAWKHLVGFFNGLVGVA